MQSATFFSLDHRREASPAPAGLPEALPLLAIERIVAGGLGLCRLPDGLVVLLPLVLPGELVRARPLRQRRGYLEAEVEEIVQQAAGRVRPVCPLAGDCGGCDMMHAEASLQLAVKEAILSECLARAGADQALAVLRPILPSPLALGYRNRLRLHLDPTGRPGLRRAGSDRVVPLSHCPVAAEELNHALELLAGLAAQGRLDPRWQRFDLQLSPADGLVFGHLSLPRTAAAKIRDRLRKLAGDAGLADIRISPITNGPAIPHDTGKTPAPRLPVPGPDETATLELRWEAGGFCQINTGQNQVLVTEVCRLVRPSAGQRVLDLYCGMGNFSLPLAARGAEVLGLEQDHGAVAQARANAAAHTLAERCRFQAVAAATGLQALVRRGEHFHAAVLDPPRQGLDKDVPASLARLRPERIVLVSCDPATLARDLRLFQQLGYCPGCCLPLDMFPQTSHVESLVLLEKNW